jgi:hypothetical protein
MSCGVKIDAVLERNCANLPKAVLPRAPNQGELIVERSRIFSGKCNHLELPSVVLSMRRESIFGARYQFLRSRLAELKTELKLLQEISKRHGLISHEEDGCGRSGSDGNREDQGDSSSQVGGRHSRGREMT